LCENSTFQHALYNITYTC